MGNLVNATCDVAQSDALARHVLGGRDRYFRFQPVDDIFACELNDSAETTRGRCARLRAGTWTQTPSRTRRARSPRRCASDASLARGEASLLNKR